VGEAEGVGEGDGEAVEDVVFLVVAGSVEGTDLVTVVGSVRSVVRVGGSYGPLSAADNTAATTTATSTTTGTNAITSGTRTTGRTHPSKKYHNNTANTTSTATDSHHEYPSTIGGTSTYPTLLAVVPHVEPPPRSHRRNLYHSVSVFQTVPECVVALVCEPDVGLPNPAVFGWKFYPFYRRKLPLISDQRYPASCIAACIRAQIPAFLRPSTGSLTPDVCVSDNNTPSRHCGE
jgi:hypothetical protein